MRYIILGGVAAGTKTAAKLLRQDRTADVVIYTKSQDISYAGCGLPYYIGGAIENRESLVVNTPAAFSALTGAKVCPGMEAVRVDPAAKTVTFANGQVEAYDKLIVATGAAPFVPGVPGTDLAGVFTLRTPDDAQAIRDWAKGCRNAVVVGGGFIGLETAENLQALGLSVTVVDMAAQVMPGLFDPDMADLIRRRLQERGIRIVTGAALKAVEGEGKVTAVSTTLGSFPADLAILALGIRPATDFLKDSGIEMDRGTILVDRYQQSSLPDIYAVGDCAQVKNRLTGRGQWSAMGSTANLTGRCLARNLTGGAAPYPGCLGTGVVKLAADLNAGRTGLTEDQAGAAGFAPVSITCVVDDKAHYYPGASSFVIKLLADETSHTLLGVQVLGSGSVDKVVDTCVAAISLGAKVEDLETMDFAYAPPFSTAIHPLAHAAGILENKLLGNLESFTPSQYAAGEARDYRVLDVQPKAAIPGAEWVDLTKVTGPIPGTQKDEKLLLVCAKGKRGYFLQNRLKALGYTNTRVLEGGATVNQVKVTRKPGAALSPAEIKRVKGLGFLQDKRYSDVFNGRVITRNGLITAREHRIIAEAAERFGSGAVTMTTRLTLEIQGVPYDNIQPLIDFLAGHGLNTGGTGSLVRPVVSCKGTTCQYGLIDTFALSEKIHQRFYVGYHGVILPHKFKIAVGGCPNNCVKPDLNDLGIVGQRMPMADLTKCRGCKTCQVVKGCPIHAAAMEGGKLRIDLDSCNNCGRCHGKCPFGAMEESLTGYKVYIGGRWGKKVVRGIPLTKLFTSEEEVLDVVEKAILLFRDEGISGERFADTAARLGFDYVNQKLITGQVEKDAILKKEVIGGATC